MGSGSSILNKRPKPSKVEDSVSHELKQPIKCDSNDIIEVNNDDSLTQLSKEALILKIKEMRSRFVQDYNTSNENISGSGLISRAMLMGLDVNTLDALRNKTETICQLEMDLRSQNRAFQNEKLQSQQKLDAYADEITDLRTKYSQRVHELDMELKRRINSNHQNPLIMKLSQKINEQAEVIKELEASLSRKDEIIEGFKIYESCQYNKKFNTCEETQQNNNKICDSGPENSSRNSRTFVSQDLVMVGSCIRTNEVSLPMEVAANAEPIQQKTQVHKLDPIQNHNKSQSNKVSCVVHSKNLVKLPTNIIEPSKSQKNE